MIVITDGLRHYFARKQDPPCFEPRSYIYKEPILWDGRGHELADYLTDYELRRWVEEPEELLEEVQGLLSQEKLGSDNDWNKEQLSPLYEVLQTVQDDSESEYELQLSY